MKNKKLKQVSITMEEYSNKLSAIIAISHTKDISETLAALLEEAAKYKIVDVVKRKVSK